MAKKRVELHPDGKKTAKIHWWENCGYPFAEIGSNSQQWRNPKIRWKGLLLRC